VSLLNFYDDNNSSNHQLKSKSNRKLIKTLLGVGALVGIVAVGSTLAASISLNSGSPVEFGQGVVQTSACDDSISINPTSAFANDSNGGSFALSSIIVSEIDSTSEHCYGKTFTIKGYGETGGALNLVDGVASVEVIDQGTTFALASSPDGVTISSTDGTGFILTFSGNATPISAADLYRITIESTAVGSFIVSSMSEPLRSRVSANPTYTVTTFSIADGVEPTITWYTTSTGTTSTDAPTGISITPASISSNSSTLTVNAATSSIEGSYYFKVNIRGNESSVVTLAVGPPLYTLGEYQGGKGGGTIFYEDLNGFAVPGSDCDMNCHYLEWSEISANGWAFDGVGRWSSDETHSPGTLGTNFGDGFANTQLMVTNNNSTGYTGDTSGAGYLATRYGANDNSAGQWFLPNITELIYIQKEARSYQQAGSFVGSNYFASNEFDATHPLVRWNGANETINTEFRKNQNAFRIFIRAW
jgi:hypothetical protein